MASYLKLVRDLISYFEKFELIQVPRAENANADALSKLASSKDLELIKFVPVEHLAKPSIEAISEVICVGMNEVDYILREVHEEICGNNTGGLALAQKILKQGYFWPTLKKDSLLDTKRCDKC
ncbi:Ribonuclease H [Abeliophyllum distichum]|uniref:Ribonuclease H n=1 Tax=Abeliophyllum distichum TaxID=126358 RepID=A0ABD1VZX0_9LAMI